MRTITIVAMTAFLLMQSVPVFASDNLGKVLKKTGWDRFLGTWVDAETKGKKYKSVTTWRFKDQVLESSSDDFQLKKKEVSLAGYNPKKEEAFHIGVDDQGGSSIGKWTFTKEEAVLDLAFVTPDKIEGFLQFRYKFIDDDTITVTIVLPEPIVIKMIRLKK